LSAEPSQPDPRGDDEKNDHRGQKEAHRHLLPTHGRLLPRKRRRLVGISRRQIRAEQNQWVGVGDDH